MPEQVGHETVSLWLGSGFLGVLLVYSAYNLRKTAERLDKLEQRQQKTDTRLAILITEHHMMHRNGGRRTYDPTEDPDEYIERLRKGGGEESP